ncbi:MAG: transcriptional regulator, BadM/Rrf2 family [uncultured bacterium]|nr:MAG: transcriptional regulator, BadM/Rrf2 family [uncultured bacterium]
MKIINRDTDFAVQALMYIASSEKESVTARELKDNLKLPYHFLRKILQNLQKNGLLKSTKGKVGGFQLNRKTDEIFLPEVIKIFQGDITINECILKNKKCKNYETCRIRRSLSKVEEKLLNELNEITINKLVTA